MRPRVLGALLLAAVVAPVWLIGPTAAAAGLALDRPAPGPVLAPFDAPTRYGPGHRGVDLAAPLESPVLASAAGRVTFAGRVVDATWVTIDHGPVRTTVGPLRTVLVSRGDRVARGQVVGTSGRAHGRPAVHWSARRGDTYLDPLAVGGTVATLVPPTLGRGTIRAPDRAGAGAPTPAPARAWPGRRVR